MRGGRRVGSRAAGRRRAWRTLRRRSSGWRAVPKGSTGARPGTRSPRDRGAPKSCRYGGVMGPVRGRIADPSDRRGQPAQSQDGSHDGRRRGRPARLPRTVPSRPRAHAGHMSVTPSPKSPPTRTSASDPRSAGRIADGAPTSVRRASGGGARGRSGSRPRRARRGSSGLRQPTCTRPRGTLGGAPQARLRIPAKPNTQIGPS